MKHVFAALFIFSLATSTAHATRKIGNDLATVLEMQAAAHIPGTKVAFTDSVWYVTDFDGKRCWAKAIYCHDTATAGYIKIHPVGSDSGCGRASCDSIQQWRWMTIKLNAGDWRGIIFDAIKQIDAADTLARDDYDVLQ